MSDLPIRVVWITTFSNSEVRSYLSFRKARLEGFIRKLTGSSSMRDHDFAQWVTNGINCMKKHTDVELHVISPHHFLKGDLQEFVNDGIHYHFYASEAYSLSFKINAHLGKVRNYEYLHNRKRIIELVNKINPDIIHLIGAENEDYALSILDMPKDKPIIAQLQTLLNDPEFIKRSPIYSDYKRECERKVLLRADYIGTTVLHFKSLITANIKKDAKYLDMKLAVGEDAQIWECEKKYDFVYFSVNINKAADYALEAFGIVCRKYPYLTLNIIGGYDETFKSQLDTRAKELGIYNNISYQGLMPTHDDVIEQARSARFALLPLKVDMITGTIRESMSLGLPVVTTITPATPELNANRESVLLSEKGDHEAMATNMIKLIESEPFAEQIRQNAKTTLKENYNNDENINQTVKIYHQLINL